jgi:putative autoinducer-2 (AI-2) aldolase
MADLDDIRDGREYGVGVEQKTDGFFLKGSNNLDWGMKDRLSRIFNPRPAGR